MPIRCAEEGESTDQPQKAEKRHSYRFGVIMSGYRSAWQRRPVGLFRRNDRAQVPESVSGALARRPYLSRIQTPRKRIGITLDFHLITAAGYAALAAW
jgi:hypothetical protein